MKLAKILSNAECYPGALLTEYHDFTHYSPIFDKDMLNWDSSVVKASDLADRFRQGRLFVRPTSDGKLFDAAVFTPEEWSKRYEALLRDKPHSGDALLQAAAPKLVQKEIRVWVVDSKVVTASAYRVNMRYNISADVDPSALEFAQRMADRHSIAPAYVMDVGLHEDKWKIVELGCVNHAGFYNCDIQKLIVSIEELYDEQRQHRPGEQHIGAQASESADAG